MTYESENPEKAYDAELRPDEATITRTRRSLAEQLREALDTMVERGEIESWESHYGDPHLGRAGGLKVYTVRAESAYGPFEVEAVYDLTPGECMDFVNAYGYDVAIGKS